MTRDTAGRGRRREWVVRDHFRAAGCELVARSAGSLGPADVIACDAERFYLVAVRTNRWPPPSVRRALAELTTPPGTRKLAAKVTRRSVEFRDVKDVEVEVRLEDLVGRHTERKLEERMG